MELKKEKEPMSAGNWLYFKLIDEGALPTLARSVCFALGQRCKMSKDDPMVVANQVLERFKQGDYDTPGAALAQKLMDERFGNPPDAEKLVEWLHESLDVTVAQDQVRVLGDLPAPPRREPESRADRMARRDRERHFDQGEFENLVTRVDELESRVFTLEDTGDLDA